MKSGVFLVGSAGNLTDSLFKAVIEAAKIDCSILVTKATTNLANKKINELMNFQNLQQVQ